MPQRRNESAHWAPDHDDWNFPRVPFSSNPRAFFELAGLPADTYPELHEGQILGEGGWRWQHAQRVAEHCRRVEAEFLRHLRNPFTRTGRGKRHAVWCVELGMPFDSASAAARFVGRAPGNILRAVRLGRECGGYRWKRWTDKQRCIKPTAKARWREENREEEIKRSR